MVQTRLETVITQQIRSHPDQRINFSEYMQQCLYHPQWGYYMQPGVKIGKEGDYYTSSSVHPIFAEIVATFVAKLSSVRKMPVQFCEMGAGNGSFARSFLRCLLENSITKQGLEYIILEKSPELKHQQESELQELAEYVKWIASLEELNEFTGVFFSNELVDAFPVHVIERQEEGLFEIMVALGEENGTFIEANEPLQNKLVIDYVGKHNLQLSNGQRIEVPVAAEQWVEEVANQVSAGIWLTIDYGLIDEQFHWPQYRQGTLRCFAKHQLDDQPLVSPGQKDITAHVHFDALARTAQGQQWEKAGLYSQTEFLLMAGIVDHLQEHASPNPFDEAARRNRAIRELITPGGMSDSFQVLVLTKKVDGDVIEPLFKPFSYQALKNPTEGK